jgi:hypothetical protein
LFRQKSSALRDQIVPLARWPIETVAIYLAIAFFPSIIALGAAVDYSRAKIYKTEIQAALDAAVLSGGRDGGESWTQTALNAFNANLSSKYGPLPKPTFALEASTGNYTGIVTDSLPTSILSVVNISSIGVTVKAAAIADGGNSYILTADHVLPKSHIWSVSKLSGDAFLITSAGQKTALAEGAMLKPGNNIRTGPNGGVLLARGQETILVSSNSVIGIPVDETEGMSTTINQWAGSILLAVEKRNDKHFEVVTPYLTAVVKGTRFRVTVKGNEASVDVLRGQVEVGDFKSGQHAVILPGQAAKVTTEGPSDLLLSGTGTLGTILRGPPRRSSVKPIDLASESFSLSAETQPGRQEAATSPKAETKWMSPSFERIPSKENTRSTGLNLLGWIFNNADGRTRRDEDVTLVIAFAFSVGFIVAFIVAVRRRWRRIG